MKSSPTPSADRTPPQGVLVDGVCAPLLDPPSLADPYAAWIDLMEAVEALCPRWPSRAPNTGGDYRL